MASKGILSSYGAICLALVFMIFAWGTGYKVSLYYADHAATSAPAKVCTRGSDAARSALDHAATDVPAPPQTPQLFAVLLPVQPSAQLLPRPRRDRDTPHELSPLSRAPVLYLRPPPPEARSLD